MITTVQFILVVSVSATFLLTLGCDSRKLTREEIVGNYTLTYPHGTEMLTLKADGTFDQNYAPSARGEQLTNSGKWRLDQEPRTTIILEHAMIVNDSFKNLPLQPPQYSAITFNTRRIAGKVELVVDSDGDLYYRQARNKP